MSVINDIGVRSLSGTGTTSVVQAGETSPAFTLDQQSAIAGKLYDDLGKRGGLLEQINTKLFDLVIRLESQTDSGNALRKQAENSSVAKMQKEDFFRKNLQAAINETLLAIQAVRNSGLSPTETRNFYKTLTQKEYLDEAEKAADAGFGSGRRSRQFEEGVFNLEDFLSADTGTFSGGELTQNSFRTILARPPEASKLASFILYNAFVRRTFKSYIDYFGIKPDEKNKSQVKELQTDIYRSINGAEVKKASESIREAGTEFTIEDVSAALGAGSGDVEDPSSALKAIETLRIDSQCILLNNPQIIRYKYDQIAYKHENTVVTPVHDRSVDFSGFGEFDPASVPGGEAYASTQVDPGAAYGQSAQKETVTEFKTATGKTSTVGKTPWA